MKNRYKFIDIARGISIISIVIGHIIVNCNELYSIYKFFLSFNVIVFFFLSGLTFNVDIRFDKFLSKKILRLLVPYFLFAFLFLIPYLFFGENISSSLGQDESSFKAFSLIKEIFYGVGEGNRLKQNSSLWFIPALFTTEIIYYFICKIDSRISSKYFSIILLLVLITCGFFSLKLNYVFPFGLNSTFQIGFFLYFGYFIKNNLLNYLSEIGKSKKILFIIFLISIILVIPLIYLNDTINCKDYLYGNYFIFIIISLLSIVWISILSILITNCKLLEYIGRITIEILVIHKVVILIFQTMLGEVSRLYLEGPIILEIIISIFVFFYTMSFCIVWALLSNKYIPFVYGKKYFEKIEFNENLDKSVNKNNNIKNILKVTLSNFTTILSSILVGFLLPKILGVTDYGYFKTFTLYITYTGVLSLGISEGLYLKYGGCNYDDLNHSEMRYYSKVLIISQFILSLIFVIISLCLFEGNLKYISIFVSLYSFCGNVNNYYGLMSQATKRFNELSIRNVIRASLITIVIIVIFLLHEFNIISIFYYHYTILFILIYFILDLWYIYTYRKITFGKTIFSGKKIIKIIKLGLPLMFSNLVGTILLTIDRQFVNIAFSTEEYAVYAFAYNMLSLVTIATSAISTIIYPLLKKADKSELKDRYITYTKYVYIFISGTLFIYFPLAIFINWFLPSYSKSIIIFRIIFPGLILNSIIQVVMMNFYKVLNKTFYFFVKSTIVILLSIGLDIVAYLLFKSTISISIFSLVAILFWYILTEYTLVKELNIKFVKNIIYILSICMLFYLTTILDNYILGAILYVTLFLFITFLIDYKNNLKLIKKMKNKIDFYY